MSKSDLGTVRRATVEDVLPDHLRAKVQQLRKRYGEVLPMTMPTHIAVNVGMNQFGVVTVGKSGWDTGQSPSIKMVDDWVVATYQTRMPTEFEREAAMFGALFGWDQKGADPALWERRKNAMAKRA